MIFRLAIVILAALMAASCTARSQRSQGAAASASAPPEKKERVEHEWMKPADYRAGGPVPAMEPNRRINEQDCTQDINLAAGNLRCK